jgi:hypothetical protein
MSSFDATAAGRRYLRIFAATFIALGLAIATLCWATDPTGLLRPMGLGGGWCADGISAGDERFVKPALPRILQPEDVIIGSSRVGVGFGPEAFPGRRIANLGISGASAREIDALARHAADEPALRRLWLGLDFGAFIEREDGREPLVFPSRRLDRSWTALTYGLADERALRAALALALSPGDCASRPLTRYGFRARELPPVADPAHDDPVVRAHILRLWALPDDGRRRIYAARLATLDRLLADLRRRDLELILYLSPTSRGYREMLSSAGLGGLYNQWRADISALASRHGARLIESDTPGFLAAIPTPACAARSPEDCLFRDLVHFRPVVGDAIARAALVREARPPSGPAG